MQTVQEITHFIHVRPKGCSKIPHHQTHYHDLTIVTEGEMTYFCNGTRIDLKPGDAVYLPPGIWRDRNKGEDYVDFISYNFLTGMNEPIFPDNHIVNCYSSRIKKLASICMESHLSASPYSAEKCNLILNCMLYDIAETYQKPYGNDYINELVDYINSHITERLSLEQLASRLHLSKEYCSMLFKRETGKTLIGYINERKLEVAKSLISGEHMSLHEISDYLGYNDYNYFSRIFKQYTGISPSEY